MTQVDSFDEPMLEARWPEAIVYICKATQGAVVNVAPMFHAGLGNIVGLVVLCGAAGPGAAGADVEREALAPARRLAEIGRTVLNLPSDRVLVRYGDPDSVLPWAAAMRDAAALAGELGAEGVFNLQGGRAAMTWGALMSWPEDGPPLRVFHLCGRPLRAMLVTTEDGETVEYPLQIADHLSMEMYLAIYGVRETNPEEGRSSRSVYARRRKDIDLIYQRSIAAPQRLWALNDSLSKLAKDAKFPLELKIPAKHIDAVKVLLQGTIFEERLRGPGLTFEEQREYALLAGVWLEGLVFTALSDALWSDADPRDVQDVSISCNIGLSFMRSGARFGEIDVAIMKGDQLHLIEVKAVAGSGQIRELRKHLEKLVSHKRQLLGQQGEAWLVAPFLSANILRDGDFERAAREAGVRLLTGPNAVPRLIEEIRALP